MQSIEYLKVYLDCFLLNLASIPSGKVKPAVRNKATLYRSSRRCE